MRTFPFPDRVESREELERDLLYERIPEEDRIRLCDLAWDRGVKAALELWKRYPEKGLLEIAAAEGVKVVRCPEERVNAAFRIFGEYSSGENEITLYLGAIEKWAGANALSMEEAEDLVLAHEFFHFLECTKLGETSKLFQVPTLRIGKWVLIKSGIRALSEIGAHGFSRACFEATQGIQ